MCTWCQALDPSAKAELVSTVEEIKNSFGGGELLFSIMLLTILNTGREQMRKKLLEMGPDAPEFFVNRARGWGEALNYVQDAMLEVIERATGTKLPRD